MLVGAVLGPHRAEHPELDRVRLAAEERNHAAVLVLGEPVALCGRGDGHRVGGGTGRSRSSSISNAPPAAEIMATSRIESAPRAPKPARSNADTQADQADREDDQPQPWDLGQPVGEEDGRRDATQGQEEDQAHPIAERRKQGEGAEHRPGSDEPAGEGRRPGEGQVARRRPRWRRRRRRCLRLRRAGGEGAAGSSCARSSGGDSGSFPRDGQLLLGRRRGGSLVRLLALRPGGGGWQLRLLGVLGENRAAGGAEARIVVHLGAAARAEAVAHAGLSSCRIG